MRSIFKLGLTTFIKKRILPNNLLSRFFLIIIIPTLIGQIFALHLFYKRHWYNVSYYNSSIMSEEILSLTQKNLESSTKNINNKYLNLTYNLLKNQTLKPIKNPNIEELEIFKKSLNSKIKFPYLVFKDDNKIIVLIQLEEDLLNINFSSKILISPTTYIFALWLIFLTILLLSVSLIFSRNQIKSILELTNIAEKYGRGEKITKYKPSGANEIRKAGLAFIKMKDRIERQTARRTKMLAMISHDLKTPLTRMKLQVELMEDSDEKEELNYDITSMQYMISSYLDFARGEGGEEFQKLALNQWIKNYMDTCWKNIEYKIPKKKNYIQIKPHSFARALDNIIGNAKKYAKQVKVSVTSKNKEAIIIIEDDGKGIAQEDINLSFKPFYRGDKARMLGDSGSSGLGLAITKEIILGHYGSIKLEKSKNMNGLLVRIIIPVID